MAAAMYDSFVADEFFFVSDGNALLFILLPSLVMVHATIRLHT